MEIKIRLFVEHEYSVLEFCGALIAIYILATYLHPLIVKLIKEWKS